MAGTAASSATNGAITSTYRIACSHPGLTPSRMGLGPDVPSLRVGASVAVVMCSSRVARGRAAWTLSYATVTYGSVTRDLWEPNHLPDSPPGPVPPRSRRLTLTVGDGVIGSPQAFGALQSRFESESPSSACGRPGRLPAGWRVAPAQLRRTLAA